MNPLLPPPPGAGGDGGGGADTQQSPNNKGKLEGQLGLIGGPNPPETATQSQSADAGQPEKQHSGEGGDNSSRLEKTSPQQAQQGVRQMIGNFTVLSTMVCRSDQGHQELVERNYKGGFSHPESESYFPSVQERYSVRIQEVNDGNAVGHGLLWMDPNRQFEPVLIDMLKPMNYTLRTPIARTSLLNAINDLGEDLRKIEILLDRPCDFDSALPLSENLYIRSRGNHLPKLTAVFLELFTRINDMLVLQKSRDEFMGALRFQDVNQYKDTFFAPTKAQQQQQRRTEDINITLDLLDQYLESELTEVLMYCVCVAWTSIDELQGIANQ